MLRKISIKYLRTIFDRRKLKFLILGLLIGRIVNATDVNVERLFTLKVYCKNFLNQNPTIYNCRLYCHIDLRVSVTGHLFT